MYKILWVYDNFNGPYNGLCADINTSDKYWFRRESDHKFKFDILKISPELLDIIEQDHSAFCKTTNTPFNHGDPRPIKNKELRSKMDVSQIVSNNSDNFFDVDRSVLSNVIKFNHTFNPEDITGELITTVDIKGFTNYYVPHSLI
jgi:hypothetical protein